MEELVDLMVSNESPSQVADRIKDILFAKSASKIEDLKPSVANSLFNDASEEPEEEIEVDQEQSEEEE
jgi:hypothetical protein|tara:strand:+ start:896 stop:1099 length:204 start_codon:yes stop_codon:yes gene_type:complete